MKIMNLQRGKYLIKNEFVIQQSKGKKIVIAVVYHKVHVCIIICGKKINYTSM